MNLFAMVLAAFEAWGVARRRSREDARFWSAARSDARLMAELSRAMDAHAREFSRG